MSSLKAKVLLSFSAFRKYCDFHVVEKLVLFFGLPMVAGTVLWNRVCPSVQTFSWNWIIRFFKFLPWCWKPILSCVWQSRMFWKKKKKLPQKWSKDGVFFNLLKNFVVIFSEFGLFFSEFGYLLSSLTKPKFWEKSGSWDMGENALGRSDCRIFKSPISLEQNDSRAWDNWEIIKKIIGCARLKMDVATLTTGLWNWLHLKKELM